MITGSYRQDDVLEIWDIRKSDRRVREIPWYGTKVSEMDTKALNKEEETHVVEQPAEEERK